MQRGVTRGSFVAFAIIAATLFALAGRFIGGHACAIAPVSATVPGHAAPAPSLLEDGLFKLAPKASLEVVQGEKTVAPAVPAPVTRSENKIVEYKLTVRETDAKIAPNLTYISLWTFDGVVPGPVMRVKVGDVIRFTLDNDKTSVTSHNIDFHFVSGACGGCCDTAVQPGEAKTIEVRALYPGLFMYHCAYNQDGNMAAVHIANGMYGFLIVDPQVPLPTVNHEFILIESEFYVEPEGKNRGLCSFSDLVAETPNHFFFNGKSAELNPALTVAVNDRVRLYVGKVA
jgi:nitrite reductase (NO-forming)